MNKITLSTLLTSLAAACIFIVAGHAQNKPERLEWFRDLGFGMFIHWNVDGTLGGVISHSMAGASKDYLDRYISELPKLFNPRRYNPDEWAELAKLAGMQYVVFTAKHHAGFCMWDSKTTDFDVMSTPYGKDLTKPLIDAFRKQGIAKRLYTNNQWPNPVVVKITNARAGVTPPRVETLTARWNAANKTVVVTGRLDDLGKAAAVEVGAQYRIKPEATEFTSRPWQTTNLTMRNATGEFAVEVGGLGAGQRYEFRVLVKHPLLSVTGKEIVLVVAP